MQPQCGPDFLGDEHRAQWLAGMLRQEDWSKFVRAQKLTTGLSSEQFYTILLSTAQELTSTGTASDEKRPPGLDEMAYSLNMNQFARPIRNTRARSKSNFNPRFRVDNRRRRTKEELAKLKARTKCLKCGKVRHWRAECTDNTLTLTDPINSRIRSDGGTPGSIRHAVIALVRHEEAYQPFPAMCHDAMITNDIDEEIEETLHELDADPFELMCNSLGLTEGNKEQDCEEYSRNALAITETNLGSTIPTHYVQSVELIDIDRKAPKEEHPRSGTPWIPTQIHEPSEPTIYWLSGSDSYEQPASLHVGTKMFNVPEGKNFPPSFQLFFEEALLDTGAQRSVIGSEQAIAYHSHMDPSAKMGYSHTRFRFGAVVHNAIGTITISIPTPTHTIQETIDIVRCNVPLLLSLEFLDRNKLQVLNVTDELQSVKENWFLPLTRKKGHICLTWNPIFRDYYTKAELNRLHKSFAHPSARKLYDLLRRASNVPPPNTLAEIEAVTTACATC